MPRPPDYEFGSRPLRPLFDSEAQKTRQEEENALRQFHFVRDEANRLRQSRRILPELIAELNRLSLLNVYADAGEWRTGTVVIDNSNHIPPRCTRVLGLVDELCEYLSVNGTIDRPLPEEQVIHLAAYALWRLNWIHPFMEGNGRTARGLMYLMLCVGLNFDLPGTRTVADLLYDYSAPYYEGLAAADKACREDPDLVNVEKLEWLISDLLAIQLSQSSI